MTSASEARDPGLDGVVPFEWSCHRCGRCCAVGEGHVWLEEGEAERIAARLGLAPDEFERRHVRTVADPRTGATRRSLRESPDGRCALLAGENECTVYEDRPAHCRAFPYWPSVLADADGFERARAVCPGIRPTPTASQRAEAFARLEALYAELEEMLASVRPVCILRGGCCRFEEAGHELWATGLEADHAAARAPDAPPPEAPGRCPYHVAGRCTARGARPLGCRTYFCDRRFTEALQATHERLLGEIRLIERETGYPRSYGRFPELLAARGVGTGGNATAPRSSCDA